jgi:hypothetical protein
VWLDHWDLISKAYARTGALKTYFTRAVKLTHQGAVDDLKKSVLSYLKNNPFPFDAVRQVRRHHTRMIIPTYPLSRAHMIS